MRSSLFSAVGCGLLLGLSACSGGDMQNPARTGGAAASGASGSHAGGGGFGNGSGGTGFGNSPVKPGAGGVSGTTGAGAVPGTDQDCAKATLNSMRKTPTILFVIDGSGSMCADFGNSTRWKALRTALADPMIGLIYRLQQSVHFGMLLYDGTIDLGVALGGALGGGMMGGGGQNPQCAGMYLQDKMMGECPQLIEVAPAVNNAAAIDAMYPMTELGGSTPTDKAMNHAVDGLVATLSSNPDVEQNPLYIILATDGQPNDICVDGMGGDGTAQQTGVVAAVDRAWASNITTFVISLAGDDAALQAHLDNVAKHGNPNDPNAHTYTPQNPDDLVDALAALLGGAVGCDVTLNGAVTAGQECTGYVELNGNKIPCCQGQGTSWTCDDAPTTPANGWLLKNDHTIELTGDTCTNFLSTTEVMLNAGFPCDVFSPD